MCRNSCAASHPTSTLEKEVFILADSVAANGAAGGSTGNDWSG